MPKITYVVSDSPNRIELSGEETLSQYETPEQAGTAITAGWHGEYGRKFVLAVTITSVVAEYHRPWALARKEDHEAAQGPAAIAPPGSSGRH
jgi:hypothetical protein